MMWLKNSSGIAETPLLRLWLSAMIAYVALLPSFYMMFSASNRFSLRWTDTNHYGLLLAIVLYALIVWMMWELLNVVLKHVPGGLGLGRFVGGFYLWFVVCRSVVSLYVKSQAGDFDVLMTEPSFFLSVVQRSWAKGFYYLILPFVLSLLLKGRFVHVLMRLYRAFSVLLLFVVVLPLTYSSFDSSRAVVPDEVLERAGVEKKGVSDVLIFLFDEWSWDRTFPNEEVWDELPFLSKWVKELTLYRQAYSPGLQTTASIPQFLFQNDEAFRDLDFEGVQKFVLRHEAHKGASLFNALGDGRVRVVAGFWHDYANLLKGHADIVFSRSGSTTGSRLNVWGECKKILIRQFFFLRWLGIESMPLSIDFTKNVLEYNLESVHAQTFSLLEEIKAPMVGFFHYCLPHFPYVYDRGGRRDDIVGDSMHEQTVSNYLGNLRYMDEILEEIVTHLKEVGRYEDALIVMTSDHSWRHDPEYADPNENHRANRTTPMKHVPLFIKYPHQQEGVEVDKLLFLRDLLPVINKGLTGSHDVRPY